MFWEHTRNSGRAFVHLDSRSFTGCWGSSPYTKSVLEDLLQDPNTDSLRLSPTMECIFEYPFVRMPSLCVRGLRHANIMHSNGRRKRRGKRGRRLVGGLLPGASVFSRARTHLPRRGRCSGGRCVEERGYSFLRRLSPPTQNGSLICILCWRLMHTATVRFERHFCLCVPVCVRCWR